MLHQFFIKDPRVSLIFFWQPLVWARFYFVLIFGHHLLGGSGPSIINGFSLLRSSNLFDSVPLESPQKVSRSSVSNGFDFYRWPQDLRLFPIDPWVKCVKEGISQDESIFAKRSQIEPHSLDLWPSFNLEPAIASDLSLLVFSTIHIIDGDRVWQCPSSNV